MKAILPLLLTCSLFGQSLTTTVDLGNYTPNRYGLSITKVMNNNDWIELGLGVSGSLDMVTPHIDVAIKASNYVRICSGLGYGITEVEQAYIIPVTAQFRIKGVVINGGYSISFQKSNQRTYSTHSVTLSPTLSVGYRFNRK